MRKENDWRNKSTIKCTQRIIIISKGYDSNKQQRVKRNMHINL